MVVLGRREQRVQAAMVKSIEIPDCHYVGEPTLVRPRSNPPRHDLYLSNLDDQKFLRFSIKYLYLYKRSVSVEALRASLAWVLEDYYPLAGRLRAASCAAAADDDDDWEEEAAAATPSEEKLVVDCNGEGAVFAEASVDLTAEMFLEASARPNRSWRKLLYRVDAQSFVGVPPLVVQVTNLRCGGMILCVGFSHCLCDGVGSAQFLHAWAHCTAKPGAEQLPVSPVHSRRMLRPRSPPSVAFPHPEFAPPAPQENPPAAGYLAQLLQSQPLVPVSVTFTPSEVLQLKRSCVPSLKCTSFEALAAHIWRSWVRCLDPPPALRVKLLFSINVRKRLRPPLPAGFYGNGFVLGCAEAAAGHLLAGANPRAAVKRVQAAKERVDEGYVRSMVDLLEERRARPDLSASLVISQWSKLGLEEVDFGEGVPLHMGPLASEIYCLFLPVVGDFHAFTVLVSVPEAAANRFEYCMKDLWGREGEVDGVRDHEQVERGLI